MFSKTSITFARESLFVRNGEVSARRELTVLCTLVSVSIMFETRINSEVHCSTCMTYFKLFSGK